MRDGSAAGLITIPGSAANWTRMGGQLGLEQIQVLVTAWKALRQGRGTACGSARLRLPPG